MTATQAVPDRPEPVLVQVQEPLPPSWVTALPDLPSAERISTRHEILEVRLARGSQHALLDVTFDGVREMDILTFQQAVAESYRVVFEQLACLPAPYPIRFWAFVPDIHADMGAGLDRYMAFNAGRFAAYSAWCGGREALGRSVATGSAIGFGADRFVLHCLASCGPGSPVENPRQVPAYRYSRRYGPLPPCFARATSVEIGADGRRRLLVGGTASIRGENSLHVGDLAKQASETLFNLASLVRSSCSGKVDVSDESLIREGWLSQFTELRVYRPRDEDTDTILQNVLPHFEGVRTVELLRAELCRPELLVELEGVAEIEPPVPGAGA